MKTLPTEILSQIFILLRQEDQLECMFTCRLWKNIIEDSCLFRTIHVYTWSILENILRKVDKQPRLGQNVHQIVSHLYNLALVLPGFVDKFPNVQKIRTYCSEYENTIISSSSHLPWCNSIESIEEESSAPISHRTLSSNVCPNLTTLYISSPDNKIFSLLKNAPALKILILEELFIKLDDINTIHENVPNLKTLKFIDTTANSLTNLSLSNIDIPSLDIELGLLQLITVKYPNLVDLVHKTCYRPRNNEEENTIYKDGWNPLLQSLGSQLKKLSTNYMKRPKKLLSILDKNDCQIQHTSIHPLRSKYFLDFVQSRQVLYIRTLVIINIHIRSFKWLKEFLILESLEISLKDHKDPRRLSFNEVTNNSPSTLTSFTFENLILTADILDSKQYIVKDLSFTDCRLSEKVIRFIDRHFPLLSNFIIKNCKQVPKNIALRSTELKLFSFIDPYRSKRLYVVVRTIYEGEERCYFTRQEKYYRRYSEYYNEPDVLDFPPIKSRPADSINVNPDITLSCFTLKKIVLCR